LTNSIHRISAICVFPELFRFLPQPPLTRIRVIDHFPEVQLVQAQLHGLPSHRVAVQEGVQGFGHGAHGCDMLFWEEREHVRRTEVCRHKGRADTIDGDILLGEGTVLTAGAGEAN